MKKVRSQMKKGFTLMETLIAMALVGLLVSMFLTVFVPARGKVQQALSRQEAERIASVLRTEMATIRPNEQSRGGRSTKGAYQSAFDKGFYWLKYGAHPSDAIVIFSYRADMTRTPNPDGTYPAVSPRKNMPSGSTEIITIACPLGNDLHRKDIKNAVGPVFLVKTQQLMQEKDGKFKLTGSPGNITGGQTPEAFFSKGGNGSIPYGATMYYRAEFYQMYPPNPDRYVNKTWDKMGKPLFSCNLSFRR